ncbi:MAG: TIGR00282 family metallophosphoesterase [Ruminococcus sp.]|nr:TIGR00282 family metallophosphoesterase [Ruminococcus sp.]
MKNLLFIGDVVGKTGCDFLASKLSGLKKQYNIDVTVVNGENSSQGNGISEESADSIIRAGADVITTGNHAFRHRDSMHIYERDFIIRPANYPEGGCVGKGVCTLDMGAWSLTVINLMGTAFMDALDNPFTKIDEILENTDSKNILVDFHAEATSEKKAMGHYLTDRVTAIVGTHTHVQTSDEIILGGGTAYITDAGMTGPEISCLGADIGPVINTYRFHMPERFTPSANPCFLCGVVIAFDEKTGKSHKIERIIIR